MVVAAQQQRLQRPQRQVSGKRNALKCSKIFEFSSNGLVNSDTSHLQAFGKQIVLLNTFHTCPSSVVITQLRIGREKNSRQTLAERLIHKICSEIAQSRTQISLLFFSSV